jgi:hypothetical protein
MRQPIFGLQHHTPNTSSGKRQRSSNNRAEDLNSADTTEIRDRPSSSREPHENNIRK